MTIKIESLIDFIFYYKRYWNYLSLYKATPKGCLSIPYMEEIAFLKAEQEVRDKKIRKIEKNKLRSKKRLDNYKIMCYICIMNNIIFNYGY